MVNCFVGSVYGGAEELTNDLVQLAKEHGVVMDVYNPGTLNDMTKSETILIVTSTTGNGDIPPELESIFLTIQAERTDLTDKPFAVIAMGDSSYGDTYCGAGKQIRELLLELRAKELQPMLEIDAMENFDPMPPAKPWFEQFIGKIKAA